MVLFCQVPQVMVLLSQWFSVCDTCGGLVVIIVPGGLLQSTLAQIVFRNISFIQTALEGLIVFTCGEMKKKVRLNYGADRS